MSAPENPPAFPEVPGDCNAYEGRAGMTLRDWFAGQAVGHILGAALTDGAPLPAPSKLAQAAYATADAMLAAREGAAS